MMSDDGNHVGGRSIVETSSAYRISLYYNYYYRCFIYCSVPVVRLLSQHRTVDDEGRSIVAPMTGLFCLVTQRHHSAAIR